jgi:hypothetical protein
VLTGVFLQYAVAHSFCVVFCKNKTENYGLETNASLKVMFFLERSGSFL